MITGKLRSAIRMMRDAGPYLAVELLLPGGSVIAGLTWLYRRKRAAAVSLGSLKAAT